jgi:KaiC/GvpD/RAD55 family RecA-like ATPase
MASRNPSGRRRKPSSGKATKRAAKGSASRKAGGKGKRAAPGPAGGTGKRKALERWEARLRRKEKELARLLTAARAAGDPVPDLEESLPAAALRNLAEREEALRVAEARMRDRLGRRERELRRFEEELRRRAAEVEERLRQVKVLARTVAASRAKVARRGNGPVLEEVSFPQDEGILPQLRTYVDGFDEALGGGIPQGHVVLLEGQPGTLKSSLAFYILLRNAQEEGRRSLYITLEQSAASLMKQIASLGFHQAGVGDFVQIVDLGAMRKALSEDRDWLAILRERVDAVQAGAGLDLLALDSLEGLEVLARFRDRRRQIFRLFEWLRDTEVTTFVVAERPDFVVDGHVLQGRWEEDFLADGVIHLRLHMVTETDVQRRIRCVKMRGVKHDTSFLALLWDDGVLRATPPLGL